MVITAAVGRAAVAAAVGVDCDNGDDGSVIDGGGDDSGCGEGSCNSNGGRSGDCNSDGSSEETKTTVATAIAWGEINIGQDIW